MNEKVMTICGEVDADSLGRILPHEHLASSYGGWNRLESEQNPEWKKVVMDKYIPMLTTLRQEHDCNTYCEVTPGWGCRGPKDLEMWAEISQRSGVHVVASTGYFFEVKPTDFMERPISEIADGMIRDIEEGMEGTCIRAGLIKIGAGNKPDDIKLLKAAAITHKATGAPITTCGQWDLKQLELLEAEGVNPERVYFGHPSILESLLELLEIMKHGCNVIFTLWRINDTPKVRSIINWKSTVFPRHYASILVATLIAEGHLDQTLISIDHSAMSGFDGNRLLVDLYDMDDRTPLHIFTEVIEDLKSFGVTDEAIEHMLRVNGRKMLIKKT